MNNFHCRLDKLWLARGKLLNSNSDIGKDETSDRGPVDPIIESVRVMRGRIIANALLSLNCAFTASERQRSGVDRNKIARCESMPNEDWP